ncbi:MAG TPA: preprotein translocase subunit SecE [Solirubrobacteraceae bacterium]
MPGALQHASGDADEFDAALVKGAGGVPAPATDEDFEWEQPEQQDSEGDGNGTEPQAPLADGGSSDRGGGSGKGKGGGGRGGDGDSGGDAGLPAARGPSHPAAPRRPLPSRAAAFLRASWAELQRVQWPDRREVSQATAVVLGFVVVAGLYLGAADWVAQKIINFIL